jgi:hypothetical protein
MSNLHYDRLNFTKLEGQRIDLLSEYYEKATQMSQKVSQDKKWQTYLNVLAVLAFEEWFKEWGGGNLSIDLSRCTGLSATIAGENEGILNVNIQGFNLCLIAVESLIDNLIEIPAIVMTLPKELIHFYIIIEIWEDEQMASIRGFLAQDQLEELIKQQNKQLTQKKNSLVDFNCFNTNMNHLVANLRLTVPSRIKTATNTVVLSSWLEEAKMTLADLGWKSAEKLNEILEDTLKGVFNVPSNSTFLEQVIENTLKEMFDYPFEPQLSGGLRTITEELPTEKKEDNSVIKKLKLFNKTINSPKTTRFLKLSSSNITSIAAALLVELEPTNPLKFRITIKAKPFVPPNVKIDNFQLMILDEQDNVRKNIKKTSDKRLKIPSFSAYKGESFCIKFILGEVTFIENFIV